MMKNILRKSLCIVLMLVLAASACMNAFAAGEDQYVSEAVIAYGDEGKAELEKAGYNVKNYNLNDGAKFADGSAQTSVWLGYKTTTNPDEAITDMAVMNMNGGYSFSNYEAVLESQKDSVAMMVEEYMVPILEFRENYAKKLPAAELAYKLLNLYWEDDSSRGLGDFFVSENTGKEQIEKLFLEGNSEYLAIVQRALAMGLADTEEGSFADKLSGMYIDDNYGKKQAAVVRTIYNEIVKAKSDLKVFYEIKGKIGSDFSGEKLSAYLEENSESLGSDKAWSANNGFEIWNLAKNIDYAQSDKSLLDVIEMDEDMLNDYWLNPFAAALTPGQAVCLDYVGLSVMLACFDRETYQSNWTAVNEQIAKLGGETASVYDGIDRTVFTPDGIALTEETAKAGNNDSGESWINGESKKENADEYSTGALIAAIICGTIGLLGVGFLVALHFFIMATEYMGFIEAFSWYNALWGLTVGAFIFLIVVCIALLLLNYVFKVFSDDEAAEKQILDKEYEHSRKPRIMVSKEEDPNGKEIFIYYYAVRDLSGEIADLNGGSNKNPEWNVLYTTKNKYMGDPISADFVLQTNNKAPSGYSAVHKFEKGQEGEKAAYNLNSGLANGSKDVFMFVQHQNPDGSLVGSGFSAVNAIHTALAAFLFGGVLSGGIVAAVNKKKRKQTA